MLSRFEHGTIVDYKAMEDIKNNDVYIVDPDTKMIRKPRTCNEWLTCQLVYVYNVPRYDIYGHTDEMIKKNEECRCWLGYLVI